MTHGLQKKQPCAAAFFDDPLDIGSFVWYSVLVLMIRTVHTEQQIHIIHHTSIVSGGAESLERRKTGFCWAGYRVDLVWMRTIFQSAYHSKGRRNDRCWN